MKYKDYRAAIKFSDEDGLFVGHVIGTRDVISFHGETVDELQREFENAVDTYLMSCKKLGVAPDREYTGKFNLRLPEELHRTLSEEAEAEDISLNDLVIRKLRGNTAA